MKILFSGEGSNINMHLMGISVKEAAELNKIYRGNKFVNEERKESFKSTLLKYESMEDEIIKEEAIDSNDNHNHNLEGYLSWRGTVLNNIGRVNQR